MACIYLDRKFYWQIHLDIIDFHNKFADKEILFTYNKILRICNKLFFLGTIVSAVSCVLYPIIDSLFISKKLILGFGFLIPFTNPEEILGYLLNFVFQNTQVVILCFGYVTFIRMYWMLFAHACVRSEILKSNLEAFNGNITYTHDDKQNQQLALMLNEIVELHIEYLRLVILFLNVKILKY